MKYILFDLDGTLTDPKEGITKSFQYALNHMGIVEENPDELEKVIGPPLKDSFMEFYEMKEEDALEAVEKYRERFRDIGIYENEIFDGVKEMLKQLQEEGFLLAIASSKPTVFVERICEHFEIKPYFHHIIGSFLDGRRGEKKEVVEEAIKEFHEKDLEKIIMVGDRKFDIIGAHQMGLKAIGVTFGYGGRKELEAAGADYIVDTVKELKELLLDLK